MPIENDPPPPEDDDDPPAEPEKPRFLLPDGCTDLVDALRQQTEREWAEQILSSQERAEGLPKIVTLPNPVTIGELATLLHATAFQIVGLLMEFNVFATVTGSISFSKARLVCACYGVRAQKAE